MNTTSVTRQYRIVVRSECGDLLAGLMRGAVITSGGGMTTIVAPVRDLSELYGLLDRLQELALPIISLTDLGPAPASPAGTAGR